MNMRRDLWLTARRLNFLLVAENRKRSRELWAKSVRREPGLSTFKRLAYVLKGHDPNEASWLLQAHGSLDGCVSRFDRGASLSRLNEAHKHLLKDKFVFAEAMAAGGFSHPAIFAYTRDGTLHWKGDGKARAEDALRRGERLVLKPVDGKGGQGIEFLTDLSPLERPRADDFLLSAFATQASYAASIFPDATNTIRILTAWHEGAPLLAAAVHRFGKAATAGVDNLHAGGVSVPIDLASGRMGRAVEVGRDNQLVRYSHHPESDAPIEGVIIPQWEQVKSFALRLANYMPGLPYVGWDIVVTDDGPLALEGNSAPGAGLHQLHARLLDGPARPFYERHIS